MKYVSLLILISFTLCSCKQTALNYNDTLISPQIQIAACLDTVFNENTSYEQIGRLRRELISRADEGLSESLGSGDFNGNREFRNKAVRYYSFAGSFFAGEELDSVFYLLNSPERIGKLDSARLSVLRKDMAAYLKIEDELLAAQKDFAEEFKLNLKD